ERAGQPIRRALLLRLEDGLAEGRRLAQPLPLGETLPLRLQRLVLARLRIDLLELREDEGEVVALGLPLALLLDQAPALRLQAHPRPPGLAEGAHPLAQPAEAVEQIPVTFPPEQREVLVLAREVDRTTEEFREHADRGQAPVGVDPPLPPSGHHPPDEEFGPFPGDPQR